MAGPAKRTANFPLAASWRPDAKEFTGLKLGWHRAVVGDRRLTNLTKVVASLMLHDFDWKRGGTAYRSQDNYADLADCSVRGVQISIGHLESRGWIKTFRAHGRGTTNLYHFLAPTARVAQEIAQQASPDSTVETNLRSLHAEEGTSLAAPDGGDETNPCSGKGEPGFVQPLTGNPYPPLPPNHTGSYEPALCDPANSVRGSASQGLAGERVSVPPEIRDLAVRHTQGGERWACSWIDPCAWDADTNAIVPWTGDQFRRIRELLGRTLQAKGIYLVDPRPPGMRG